MLLLPILVVTELVVTMIPKAIEMVTVMVLISNICEFQTVLENGACHGGGAERENLTSAAGVLPSKHKCRVKSRESRLGLPQGAQGPTYLSHHCCFLGSTLAESWIGSRGRTRPGMQTWDVCI